MEYSIHPNFSDGELKCRQKDTDWESLIADSLFNLRIVPAKSDLEVFVPVTWQSDRFGKTLANVSRVNFLVLDIDSDLTDESLYRLKQKLSAHRFFLYFTHSCYRKYVTDGLYKVRAVIPLSEPVPKQDWPRFWEKATRYFGDWVMDPQCKNANHLYYLPGVPSKEALDWFNKQGWCDWDGGLTNSLDVNVINDIDLPSYVHKDSALAFNIPLPLIEEQLMKKARKLIADEKRHDLGLALQALLRGQAYSDEGSRHDVMVRLTNLIARLYPKRSPTVLATIFLRAHEDMSATHSTEPDNQQTVESAIASAQTKAAARMAEKMSREDRHTAHAMKQATKSLDPDFRYSEEDRFSIAQSLGVPLENLDFYWIMMAPKGRQAYILTQNGIRDFHVTPENVVIQVPLLYPTGIPLKTNRGGEKNPRFIIKSLKELVETNGTLLTKIRFDNRILSHRISDTNVLSFPCPKRPLTPRYSPEVNGYLECLFGKEFEKAQQWLSVFPDTTQLLCALFLGGPPGIGKTLLMSGLGKIWMHSAPVRFSDAISRFNFSITKTPFIYSDEGLPQNKEVSQHLRNFVGSYDFYCEEKFGEVYESSGARRIVIATNNMQALNFHFDSMERADMDALQERIWICEGKPTARHYLNKFSKEEINSFADHKIAQHVLWLNENYAFTPDPSQRFAVVGSDTITSNLLLADTPSQEIFTLLMIVMQKAMSQKSGFRPVGFKWGRGRVYITGPGIRANWEMLENRKEQWTQPGRHLAKVGHKTTYDQRGKKICAYSIKTRLFYEFLECAMGCDPQPFKELIDG